MTTKTFLVASTILAAALSGAVARMASTSVPVAHEWPTDPREQLALKGIEGLWRDVDTQVAPIVTDSGLRTSLIQWIAQRSDAINKATADLLADAKARRGLAPDVALVTSGALWVVPTPTKARR